MNYQKKKKLNVPESLEKFLIEFTVEILINNPRDLNEFGYMYFKNIHNKTMEENFNRIKSQTASAANSSNNSKYNISNSITHIKEPEEAEKLMDSLNISDKSATEAETDDELLELDWELKKKTQSRRCSVFSKSYDPSDSGKVETPGELESDEDELMYEIIKNKPFENMPSVKSAAQRVQLKTLLSSIILFKYLSDEELDSIIEEMFERPCDKDEVIIKEGDTGHYFYVIMSGVYEIFIQQKPFELNETVNGTKFSEYNGTGFFGELSLLYDQPRSATIISVDKGLLFCMKRDIFRTLIIQSAFTRRKNYENFLQSLPLLTFSLNKYEISQVADSLISRMYTPGECIFKQGDDADGMYFIEKGRVKFFQDVVSENGITTTEIRMLGSGEFFGELALVNKSTRTASCYVTEDNPCKLAFLEVEAFERLIGPCRDFIKDKMNLYSDISEPQN